MRVDGFDADVRINCVLVEENRTTREVGHMKPLMKDVMYEIFRSFLHDLFLDSVLSTSSVPRVPAGNTEPHLH